MSKDEDNNWRIKYVSLPMPRDPGRCHRRISSVNTLNTTAENKWNTRLIESVPDTACMMRTIINGANPNATCRLYHVSACHIAAMHDNDALDLLLRSGANISRADKHGRTPLHLAAWAGHAKQITLLLDSLKALRGSDTVRGASDIEDHSLFLKNLVNMPCQPNEESGALPECWCDGIQHNCGTAKELLPLLQQGWTALHSASARAHHHCVQLLLATGADASAQDLLCRTPLDVAGCAHNMGHNIDANNLMKTVDLLLRAGGKFLKYSEESDPLDTPLHTAVEIESEAAVEQILLGGASAGVWNSQGLTAMHVCVEKRNKKMLQILVNHQSSNKDPDLAVVDIKDRKGYTVLCAAIEAEWIDGVCVALGAGARIIEQFKEESPIKIAVRLGNIEILQKILNIAKSRDIDYCNEDDEPILFTAIRNNHLDVLKLLLKNGFCIDVEDFYKTNVLHEAAVHGSKEIMEYLLNYDRKITGKLINVSNLFGQPLYHAVRNNNCVCAKLLISKGARVNVSCSCGEPMLAAAVHKNERKAPEDNIRDSVSLHICGSEEGVTPLHVACYYRNREMIKLLLRNGADISGAVNENNSDGTKQIQVTPIESFMCNLTQSTEFLQEIFDSYIRVQSDSTKDSFCQDVDIKVDYKVLVPQSDMTQMRVIKALIDTASSHGQDRLLFHPLVQSFLYLKWRSLLLFFYSIFVLHVCFVLSLNIFVLSIFWYKDRKIEHVPRIFRSTIWIYIIYLTACLIIIKESIFIATKSLNNVLCIETWLTLLSTILAVVVPLVLSWHSECTSEWVRLLVAVTLLFTWAKMTFLLSRFAAFGYYFLMYGKVASKVFKIMFLFIFLIFGFASSFMIQFHAQAPFEGPWSGLLTTIVMMTADIGYYETINAERATDATASLLLLRSIFVAFLVLISLILMNLLVAVAVNDVNNLEMVGNIQRLKKQVEFITSFENSRCNFFIKTLIPQTILISLNNVNNSYPLPNRLRQAIIENAQLQQKQWDEMQEKTMQCKKQIVEIHKLISKNEPKMNEILAELKKIRVELDLVIKRDKSGTGTQD